MINKIPSKFNYRYSARGGAALGSENALNGWRCSKSRWHVLQQIFPELPQGSSSDRCHCGCHLFQAWGQFIPLKSALFTRLVTFHMRYQTAPMTIRLLKVSYELRSSLADRLIQHNKNWTVCDPQTSHIICILELVLSSPHPQNTLIKKKRTRWIQIPAFAAALHSGQRLSTTTLRMDGTFYASRNKFQYATPCIQLPFAGNDFSIPHNWFQSYTDDFHNNCPFVLSFLPAGSGHHWPIMNYEPFVRVFRHRNSLISVQLTCSCPLLS